MIDESLKTESGPGYLKWLSDAQSVHPREPAADPLVGDCRPLEACIEAQSREIEALRNRLQSGPAALAVSITSR